MVKRNHATVRFLRIFNMAYQLNRFLWTYPSKVRYQSFVKASNPSFISHNLTKAVYWPCISPTRCLKSGFDHVYGEDAWCAECSRQCADGKLDWYRELLRLLLHDGNLMLLHCLSPMMGDLLFSRKALNHPNLRYWTALDRWDDRGDRSGDRIKDQWGRAMPIFCTRRTKHLAVPVRSSLQINTVFYRILTLSFTRLLSERILTLNNSTIRNRSTANNSHDKTLVINGQRWRKDCSLPPVSCMWSVAFRAETSLKQMPFYDIESHCAKHVHADSSIDEHWTIVGVARIWMMVNVKKRTIMRYRKNCWQSRNASYIFY